MPHLRQPLRALAITAALVISTAAVFPAIAIDTNHSIVHRGASANEATYYKDLSDPSIPLEVRLYIRHILDNPVNVGERVLQSALKKVGDPAFEEEGGNSNIAPGINRVLKEVGAKPGNSWCAASVTDDLWNALGYKPPIGSANVGELFNQAYYLLALFKGHEGIKAGDIVSHTDSSHAFLYLTVDPKDPNYFWSIDGNGQDWSSDTPDTAHEGERLVYRPVSKIKEYIDLQVLVGGHVPAKRWKKPVKCSQAGKKAKTSKKY